MEQSAVEFEKDRLMGIMSKKTQPAVLLLLDGVDRSLTPTL